MIIVNSPMGRLLGFIFSLVILAVVYFAIVQPALDDADKQTNQALDQSQQALDQSQKELDANQKRIDKASKSGDKALSDGQKRIARAQKLTACIQKAGTDTAAIQKCNTRFSPAAP